MNEREDTVNTEEKKERSLVPAPVTPGNALALDIATAAGLEVAFKVANALAQSGHFKDAQGGAQAFAKIIAGQELGLGPVASMNGIHTIEGKMSPGANLVATLIVRSGRYRFRIIEESAEVCRIRFDEREAGKWEPIGESDFTFAEARDADLLTKANWKKYPRDMLFARALMRGARRYTPDVFGGQPVYSPDELGAENVGPDGDLLIDDRTVEDSREKTGANRLSYLIDVFGVERVEALRTRKDGTKVDASAFADDGIYQRAEARLREEAALAGVDPATPPEASDDDDDDDDVQRPPKPDRSGGSEDPVEVAEFEEVPAEGEEQTSIPVVETPLTEQQLTRIVLVGREEGIDRAAQIEIASAIVGQPLESRKKIPAEFMEAVIAAFRKYGLAERGEGGQA